MWTVKCGCNPISYELFEFKLKEKPIRHKPKVTLPNDVDDTCCLKEKIIRDYLDVIDKLECGIQPEIESILQEISIIDIKRNNNDYSVIKLMYF